MKLKNKIILITGASIGIGRELAYKFSKEKSKLIITYYKDKKEAYDVKSKCLQLGAKEVLIIKLNIMNNKSIGNLINRINSKFGKITILINNAGVIIRKPISKQTNKEIEEQIRTNLEGLIKLTNKAIPYIDKIIINMGSAAGLGGYNKMPTYCASKWGVRGFTQILAREFPKLNVYNFVSGGVATRMKNFHGIAPEKIADVIVNFVKKPNKISSGSDINARDYLKK